MKLTRPVLSVEALIVLTLVFLLATANGPFWRAALTGRDGADLSTWTFAAALAVLAGALHFVVISLVATRWSVRPILAVLCVAAAAASFFMDRYAIYLDRSMLRNVLASDFHESREQVTWAMLVHVGVWGVLPALALWWPRLTERRWLPALGLRLASVALATGLGLAAIWPVLADFSSLMRNHKEVRYLLTPGNAVMALAGNAWGRSHRRDMPLTVVGGDAHLSPAWNQRKRPTLFVMVVGETARAQNLAFNGYERSTNPQLAQRNMLNFPDAWSCGTSTEVSLPCMFSSVGRRHYDEDRIASQESLLHVLARAGFSVRWRDNQSGCKGVCTGLPTVQLSQAGVESLCPEGQCLDEVLLHGMDQVLADTRGNLVVVMHQLGSHGPSYFRRYPAAFKRFIPACENDDLRLCTSDEIRNAYDNSLLYTDHFLARVVDYLQARQDRYDTALLYMSDHGESLGEKGLYLHGMPYRLAPDEQLHVPLLAWLSPAFRKSFGVQEGCLREATRNRVSHDHLFHSVLGLLDVNTSVYERSLDLFAPCRSATGTDGVRLSESSP